MPIYNLFVERAKKLNPRYLSFVTPSRWMAGGKYLDEFRTAMLNDTHISQLVDYPNSAEMFPSVDIKGGVNYFLWDAEHDGDCEVTLVRNGEVIGPNTRKLNEFDVFVRDRRAVDILHKVLAGQEATLTEIVSTRDPFGPALSSNFTGYTQERVKGWPRLYMQGGDRNRWVDPDFVTRNKELIDEWKVLVPKAGPGNSGGHVLPDMVLGRPVISEPHSVCTLTYLVVGPLPNETACESLSSYLRTRFARFLISLRKPGQDAARGVYAWVPQQTWDRVWTDEMLYKKYGITSDEIAFINSMIRPMDESDQ
jgi:site-specific DNA-methyltransferase (adenine-specific)